MTPPTESPHLVERIIEASARNKFLVILFTLAALAAAVWAVQRTPLDAVPDLSDTQVIVYTDWEGRSPDLIEDQITYPISARFIAAPHVKFVRGESMFGKSFVYVIFEDGTDMYWARSRVIEYLSSVRASLPDGANPVIGPDATGVGWVFEYALVDESGRNSLADLRGFQDWHLRYALESVKGVAEVAPVGGFTKEYQVDIDPNKLLAYGLSLGDVADKIRASNKDVGGKTFEVGSTEYYVRGRGYIRSLADIEGIPLRSVGGTPVTVRDVATVHLGPGARRGVAELDGKGEVVGGVVVMRYGENALDVIDGIKRKIREIEPSLPPGMRIVPTYDRSGLIRDAVGTLREKLLEECVVVALVCLVFLWHVRSALVAIVTLPAAILLAFLPLHALGLTSNIMSLGGIAIAVGAMVDAAIIMVENAHKQLEHFRGSEGREPTGQERVAVVVAAARSVGRPLFFSLLVITVSFFPVFSLSGQEGRLFKPLAFTKTFSMAFASLLGITLVPVLMVLLVRGRITPEARNPVNRLLVWLYQPVVRFVLRHRWTTLGAAAVILAVTVVPFRRLGSEFMPPLNEGSILFMPTAAPGMSIGEASRILQVQDALIRSVPEVETVFGKAGEAQTPTDPAPLSMFETVVTLRPHDQWRPAMTWEGIVSELNAKLKTPGMANSFWMPIQTRTEMLTTGFRSVLGVKVFGPDMAAIEDVGLQIEKALEGFPGTRSVFAERTTGGYYLDVTVNRAAAARYGLTVDDVNDMVESGVGGKVVSTTVEGRERYPISVRYARDFRESTDALSRVLVSTPTGVQVPLSALAEIGFRTGPPSIRDENGQLVGFVFVDATQTDIEGYVRAASARIRSDVKFPPGTYIQWTGQFEYLQSAQKRLAVVVPFTLLAIFMLIFVNTRSVARTVIVLLAVPFSLVGAFWFLYLLHYNLSVAVWVGLIALAGLDAETGVVMLLYLDHAWDRLQAAGRLRNTGDLDLAILEGAVQRIRPKIMTVCAILFGLLPIMWSPTTQVGADVMKRIAAPMIGGVVTSAILELLLYPAIYSLWRGRSLAREKRTDPGAPGTRGRGWSRGAWLLAAIAATVAVGVLVTIRRNGPTDAKPAGTLVERRVKDGLEVSVYTLTGPIRVTDNVLIVTFVDNATHAPADPGELKLDLVMDMPGMTMHSGATVVREAAGRYRVSLRPEMAGDQTLRLQYGGASGLGTLSLSVSVLQ